MFSNNSLDFFSSRRGDPQHMSAPSNTEETYKRSVRKQKFSPLLPLDIHISPDSLTFVPSAKEVLLVCQTRDETSYIWGYRVILRKLIIKEDDDDDLVIHVRSSGESQESIRKAS